MMTFDSFRNASKPAVVMFQRPRLDITQSSEMADDQRGQTAAAFQDRPVNASRAACNLLEVIEFGVPTLVVPTDPQFRQQFATRYLTAPKRRKFSHSFSEEVGKDSLPCRSFNLWRDHSLEWMGSIEN